MVEAGSRGRGVADPQDEPIAYRRRIRDYYAALGFEHPYVWAHHAEVPFQPLKRPLSELRVTLITTAAPYRPEFGDQSAGAAYNAAAKFYRVYSGDASLDHDLRVSHVAIDRKHGASDDQASYFPLVAMREAVAEGRIGGLTARFHGAPTNRSQRVTMEVDCPELLARCREDGADAAILVPNCPICHQSMSLAARHLEANGIATVIMGAAKDIVEHVGVPRFLFSDFPLGNAAGRPNDAPSQRQSLQLALRLLETAPRPRTTQQSPLRWSDDHSWKLDYLNVERLSPEEIQRLRADFDRGKTIAKEKRREAGLREADAIG